MKYFKREVEKGKAFIIKTDIELATFLVTADYHMYKRQDGILFTDIESFDVSDKMKAHGQVIILPKKGTYLTNKVTGFSYISFKLFPEEQSNPSPEVLLLLDKMR